MKAGKTINLYTEPREHFNTSEILGRFSMADDIADNMMLGKSNKNVCISVFLSVSAIGAFVVAPMMQQMMK